MLANGAVDEVEKFTYLGSAVSRLTIGGIYQDVEATLGKVRSTVRVMEVEGHW